MRERQRRTAEDTLYIEALDGPVSNAEQAVHACENDLHVDNKGYDGGNDNRSLLYFVRRVTSFVS